MGNLVKLHRGSVYKVGNVLVPIDRQGLVGFWPFGEGSGTTAYDESKTGNDGTLKNGPTWVYDSHFGYVLDFDGVDDYVEVPYDSSLDITGPLTVSVWSKLDSGGRDYCWVEKGIGGATNEQYLLLTGRREFFIFRVVKNDSNYSVSGSNYPVDEWFHLVGVYDGSAVKLYVNGNFDAEANAPSPPLDSGTGSVWIGRLAQGGYNVNGKIDDVRVYDRALSESEITNIYQKTKP